MQAINADVGHEAPDEDVASRHLMRHGFVWWLVTFSSFAGLYSGYCIGLVGALFFNDWASFHSAFPDLDVDYAVGNPAPPPPPGAKAQDPQAVAVSIMSFVFLIGAMCGSLPCTAGELADSLGRKRAIIAYDFVALVATILLAATPEGPVG
jgi:MFS family permease